ncbi:hypothetical protein CVS29_17385 [Arthrobacter psychrochitiniphilus]|uniref:Uncharacterized protein n=2 Tax=Arthrobacter psychrochitiniphilus TaxID=291045 RepID=A0A2V3DM72_9MICC|nr:hypothetical protein CVS29_17385 [Arthrobacter psychrochitiniphilus]
MYGAFPEFSDPQFTFDEASWKPVEKVFKPVTGSSLMGDLKKSFLKSEGVILTVGALVVSDKVAGTLKSDSGEVCKMKDVPWGYDVTDFTLDVPDSRINLSAQDGFRADYKIATTIRCEEGPSFILRQARQVNFMDVGDAYEMVAYSRLDAPTIEASSAPQ